MSAGFPPVVRATVAGHRAVAVRCSNIPDRPWLAIDVDKGWTRAHADHELEDQVELGPKVGFLDQLFKSMVSPPVSIPPEDRWRVRAALFVGDSFEGEADEVWSALVRAVDDDWSVNAIEQWVRESWRRRSVLDLLEAAGVAP